MQCGSMGARVVVMVCKVAVCVYLVGDFMGVRVECSDGSSSHREHSPIPTLKMVGVAMAIRGCGDHHACFVRSML